MSEAVSAFLLVYAGLFPIVNPLGSAPVFLSLTRRIEPATRHRMAWKVARNGFFLLLGSILIGSHILTFFGITIPVVRVAGGLVVTVFGWRLLNTGEGDLQPEGAAEGAPLPAQVDAFYPLTMPLTVGPGSIAVAVTLGSQRPALESFGQAVVLGLAALLGLLAVVATVYIAYRFADRLGQVLGQAGTDVMVRLSAFLLLCIGIQILWSGWSALMHLPPV